MDWNKLDDRKWDLKCQDKVLATIYCKPMNGKFSLYISSPKVYKSFSEMSKTYQYDTLEEAQEAFDVFIKEDVLPWAEAVAEYVSGIISHED